MREVNRMNDLISRQAAIDAIERAKQNIHHNIERAIGDAVCEVLDAVENGIKQLPPIQPKRGHWIEADVCGDTTSWECSCCHNWTGLPTGWNVKTKLWFCPKCTADMREVTT